ncbi:AAA family ATPase [Metapseudomonas furukawaii]|uniref:ATP-binding protein n=1 Tax=Metapseudomonas furukawaii TaxID=1149133 RepID=A0AAD1FG47_METFU|nr:AAA family ATPase [Pseudomonas furukawaii]ELS28573.1 hypothetical protein ppKF707_1659 [Pseudomonas furukawaii]BAU75161.1 putative ATP-binding protein [Pseudomonas furukawaii]
MLNSITINSSRFSGEISVSTQTDPSTPWITVLVGENGTKKSFILRLILESALGNKIYSQAKKQKISIKTKNNWHEYSNAKPIAISGTPLDRFPRTGTSALRSYGPSRNNGENFVYFGQRASNGMAGVAQSERGLLTALFENNKCMGVGPHIFREILLYLNFKPTIFVKLKLSKKMADASKNAKLDKGGFTEKQLAFKILTGLIDEVRGNLEENPTSPEYKLRMTGAIEYFSKHNRLEYLYKKILKGSSELPTLIFNGSSFDDPNEMPTACVELLIRAGILEIDKSIFFKFKTERPPLDAADFYLEKLPLEAVDGEELSSGQWSWLASFAGLCAEIRPGSLILVDEPENSLHPIWQRDYIPMLYKIMRECPGSHAVVATHAPLIASGVNPEWGNVIALSKTMTGDQKEKLSSIPIENTFGWTASDVYEQTFGVKSTRAKGFTTTADIALAEIRKGRSIQDQEMELLIEGLKMDRNLLLISDPMRSVFDGIIKKLLNDKERNTNNGAL